MAIRTSVRESGGLHYQELGSAMGLDIVSRTAVFGLCASRDGEIAPGPRPATA